MKKKIITVIVFAIIIIFAGLFFNIMHSKFDVVDTQVYVVSDDDTLWGIAGRFIDDRVDIRRYIDLIYQYNDGLTANIKAGQKITIPIIKNSNEVVIAAEEELGRVEPSITVNFTSLSVPNINSSFKTWMSYKAVTNKKSPQYQYIHTYGWSDEEGFMRAEGERELGIEDDYYLIALGSFYGTEIGTKYKITTDTGNVFYGVLADRKANIHTNSTNQYVPKNRDVVEFLVDTSKLNPLVKRMGTANVYMPLNGMISKIERIDFIYK